MATHGCPILVSKVTFLGFWGLVFIEKWSQNFDLGDGSTIFWYPKWAIFQVPKNGTSESEDWTPENENVDHFFYTNISPKYCFFAVFS